MTDDLGRWWDIPSLKVGFAVPEKPGGPQMRNIVK